MSAKATFWAWAQHGIKPLEKLVLLALANRHNTDTDKCYPSLPRICEDTGICEKAVRNAIKSLEARGLLKRDYLMGKSTYYQLCIGTITIGLVPDTTPVPDTMVPDTTLVPDTTPPRYEIPGTLVPDTTKPKRNLKPEPKIKTHTPTTSVDQPKVKRVKKKTPEQTMGYKFAEVQEAYNAIMGSDRACRMSSSLADKTKRNIYNCHKADLVDCVDDWTTVFNVLMEDDWINGKGRNGGTWKPDIEYATRETQVRKVHDEMADRGK